MSQKLTVSDLYNILGAPKIEEISRDFYIRVYDDNEDPEFRDMFVNSNTREGATWLLSSYLVQKFGGPKLYGGMRFDTTYVKDVHKNFAVTPKGAERWIYHFNEVLKNTDLGERKEEIIEALNNWTSLFAKSVINH